MNSSQGGPGDAVREALAELLSSTDIDIVGEATGRLPSGQEVQLVHGAVRGEPNRAASVVVDSSGAVQPLRRLEALYGRGSLCRRWSASGPRRRQRRRSRSTRRAMT
jgi:hypothetical protein